jgi:hypothetical protein
MLLDQPCQLPYHQQMQLTWFSLLYLRQLVLFHQPLLELLLLLLLLLSSLLLMSRARPAAEARMMYPHDRVLLGPRPQVPPTRATQHVPPVE